MNKTIDNKIFTEVGLEDLSSEDKDCLLVYIERSLKTNIGTRITKEAALDELERFEKLAKSSSDKEISNWFKINFPNFEKIMEEELTDIKTTLKDAASEIIQASEKESAKTTTKSLSNH